MFQLHDRLIRAFHSPWGFIEGNKIKLKAPIKRQWE